MDQKKRIELYIQSIRNLHEKNPELKNMMRENYSEYEQYMAKELPRFKEKYPTLFKMSIKEFEDSLFNRKLNHFLNISHNVLTGRETLEDATKIVAQEQYNEYVAPLVKNIDTNSKK